MREKSSVKLGEMMANRGEEVVGGADRRLTAGWRRVMAAGPTPCALQRRHVGEPPVALPGQIMR